MRRVTAICYVFEPKYAEVIAWGCQSLRHVRKVFKHLSSIAFLGFCWKLSSTLFGNQFFFFFSLNHIHITCKQPKSRQNVFLSSKRLSHKLLCVYGVWWGWQAIIESTKCIFSWMPGESLTQLNLFSIFNIKNMSGNDIISMHFGSNSVVFLSANLNLD